jgi:hypothetical protein
MRRLPHLLVALTITLASLGCDEKLSTLAGPTPDLDPTFASIQKDIFETTDTAGRISCVTCHTDVGRTPAGGLILLHDRAYDQLVNVSSTEIPSLMRVDPGNPDRSYMVHKIEGRAGIVGRRMPFNGPPYLTDGQILIMRRWIERGAPRH